MIMFEDNTVPERFSDAKIDYLKSTDDVIRDLCKIPQNPLNSHQDI